MPYAERDTEFHLVGFTELAGGASYAVGLCGRKNNKRVDEVQEK